MSNHEAYFYRTLYAVILVSSNGGQRMNFFTSEEKAREDAEDLINELKDTKKEWKVYLSYLDYSPKKNRIMSDEIISDESELLFESNGEVMQ